MRSLDKTTVARRHLPLLAPLLATLLAPLLLAACGGGGSSGADAGTAGVANTTLRPLTRVETFNASEATIDGNSDKFASSLTQSNQLTRITIGPGTGPVTIAVDRQVGARQVTFNQTFRSSDVIAEDSRSLLYRKEQSNGRVTMLSIAKPGNAADGFSYASLGYWLDDPTTAPGLTQGHFTYGIQTPVRDIPSAGSATYKGITEGHLLAENDKRSYLSGKVSLTANFASGAIGGRFSEMKASDNDTGKVSAFPSFGIDGQILRGENRFVGNVATDDNTMSGDLVGSFMGPAEPQPAEVAGGWRLGRNGAQAVGAFVAKR